jgi:hypothetical protein
LYFNLVAETSPRSKKGIENNNLIFLDIDIAKPGFEPESGIPEVEFNLGISFNY